MTTEGCIAIFIASNETVKIKHDLWEVYYILKDLLKGTIWKGVKKWKIGTHEQYFFLHKIIFLFEFLK